MIASAKKKKLAAATTVADDRESCLRAHARLSASRRQVPLRARDDQSVTGKKKEKKYRKKKPSTKQQVNGFFAMKTIYSHARDDFFLLFLHRSTENIVGFSLVSVFLSGFVSHGFK